MTKLPLIIATACWLFLIPNLVSAQTDPTEQRALPVPTPETTNARPKPSPELQLEIGSSYEHLTNGQDWQSYYISFSRKFTSRQLLYGSARVDRRFESADPSFLIGFYQPLDKARRWAATFEVEGSPTHEVVPKISLYGQIERNFGKGWLGHAGIRHRRYSEDTLNMGVFGVEKYFKAYRGAYTLFVANLNGKETSASHVFQGNYYYGERNSVGAGFAFGQEIESVGKSRFLRTNVQEVSLVGRHWFTEKWGLSYVGLWHRQGVFYIRTGAQAGLLLRF